MKKSHYKVEIMTIQSCHLQLIVKLTLPLILRLRSVIMAAINFPHLMENFVSEASALQ